MREDRVQVLLVEDSPSDAQLLCESLRDYPLQKFEIERAERLDEAVALLARRSFDVILLDLNLPDSSGMETCKRVSRAAGQAPIIVLTGADDEMIAAEAMGLGIQDYLVKGQIHGGVIGRTIRYAVERSQSQRALRESERQFKSTFENAAIGIAHVALDGRIRQSNSRFCEIAGHLPDDILGKTCEELTFADDWKAERVRIQHLLDGQIDHYAIEKRYIRTNGSTIWVNLTRSIQRDEAGRPEYFIVIVEDISERKRAEEALRELTATLETKVSRRTADLEQRTRQLQKLALELSQAEDRERKRLAEILHDDLQQQLAASKFHLSLLGNRVKSDASLRGALTSIEEMVNVAIEKSRSLSHELSPAVLYHGDFGEAIEWLANQIKAKHGLAVHVDIRSPIEVSSDAIKAFLFRAAQEILFNIVKHAQVTEATVRLQRRRGKVWLAVHDEGRGFDPGAVGQAAGFGLLSIRERIELLGGRMKIRSVPRRGSTFVIAVPDGRMEGGKEQRMQDRFDPSSEVRPSWSVRILRVLLVDDHKVVREGLAALLNEQEDIKIVGQAANGREAVDLAYNLQPDVIVMDVSMPLMEGDEATRQIKRDMPHARVIGLSMFEEPSLKERMHRAGAERYLSKTAPAEELLAAIRGKGGDL